jgi:negative regulator of sigma E activity
MGKISASRFAATIVSTQTAEAKKKKPKRIGLAVSVVMATVSSGIEIINVDDEEDDAKSPSAMTAPSTGTPRKAASTEEPVMETPRRTLTTEEHPRSSADMLGDVGSQKRVKKAPRKPCKPVLRSTTK